MTGYESGGAGVYAGSGVDRRVPAGRVDRDVNSVDKPMGSRTLPDFLFLRRTGNFAERRRTQKFAEIRRKNFQKLENNNL